MVLDNQTPRLVEGGNVKSNRNIIAPTQIMADYFTHLAQLGVITSKASTSKGT